MGNRIKLFSLLLIIALLATACGAKDLTKGRTAVEIIEEAYHNQENMESFEMDFIMEMVMPIPEMEPVKMVLDGQATVFQNPIQIKMVMETQDPETEDAIIVEQYMEILDETLVVYQHVEDQWFKMVFDDPDLNQIMNMDPAKNTELFLKYLTEANIVGDEKIGTMETVKIELVASSDMYNELMEEVGGLGLDQLGLGADMNIFAEMGDLKYLVWVDKASLNMVRASMDLTENMRNLGQTLLVSEDLPPEVVAMFAGMEMNMDYEIKNINQASSFTIPEEAKDAEELMMMP